MTFKKGDIIRRTNGLPGNYVVVKTNVPMFGGFNLLGKPKFRKSKKHAIIRSVNTGEKSKVILTGGDWEQVMGGKKNIPNFKFL